MRLLALWATPRTVSTAFERMMIERGDHTVLDEPWSRAFYFGPDRRSDRYPLTFPEASYDAVTAGVVATAAASPTFVKDMAYQAAPGLTDDLVTDTVHTFLVRDPDAALASLTREWPDATDEEAGYTAQGALFDRVVAAGATPVVLDSDDIRSDPAGTLEAWCDAVSIPFVASALSWTPGMRPEWPLWQDWYAATARSTGFAPPTAAAPPLSDHPAAPAAREVYDRLRSVRLRP